MCEVRDVPNANGPAADDVHVRSFARDVAIALEHKDMDRPRTEHDARRASEEAFDHIMQQALERQQTFRCEGAQLKNR